MSRCHESGGAGWVAIERGVGVALLIDREGASWQPCDIAEEDAVWDSGFIRVHLGDELVVIWFDPRLVGPVAMTAAFYEIADLNPELIFIYADGPAGKCEEFSGVEPAFRWIYDRMAAAGNVKLYPEPAAIVHASVDQATFDPLGHA
jgi:hypothetical protein